MAVRDFRDLLIWQRALSLAGDIYSISADFPVIEQFGLTSQIRRSAVSVPSNIAEGHGREAPREFARFLRIARGSLTELQTQLLLAEQFSYCTSERSASLYESIDALSRMIRGMQKSLDSQLAAHD